MVDPIPLAASTGEIARIAGATIGTLLTVPVVVFLWRVAGDWRERGNILRATGDAVKTLMDPDDGVLPRIARQEYILTGDGGTNGVRGDVGRLKVQVGEMAVAQRDAFQTVHTAMAKRDIAQDDLLARVKRLESRRSPAKRKTRRSA